MKLMKYVFPVALMFAAGNVLAADLDGAKLYIDKTCASCHGDGGNKPTVENYPKLGGQNAKYIVEKLQGYKSGDITGGQAAVMKPMASMLSDDEMQAIADYLAGVKCE